jgi:transcriptional regulator with XRE-family HTH domain
MVEGVSVLDPEAFRNRRFSLRITQLELAARARIRNDKISRFESGRTQLQAAEIARLCGALDSLERERRTRAS